MLGSWFDRPDGELVSVVQPSNGWTGSSMRSRTNTSKRRMVLGLWFNGGWFFVALMLVLSGALMTYRR
jgi:hypothetical protein